MDKFWQNKIKAFLHDPPDKALVLGCESHENVRDEILQELNLTYDSKIDRADHIASAMQRINLTGKLRKYCIYFKNSKNSMKPIFKHTLSGKSENLDDIKNFIAYGYEKALSKFGFDKKIVKEFLDKNNWKKTYFLLWRFLPEKYPLGYILPADTRIPDHSIWDHLDVTSAIYSCLKGGLSLFSIKLLGVQEFISHSRKLSDLWASSHIFSTVIFEGIKVIVDKLGPDVIIYPQLRENPMLDFASFKGEEGDFTLFDEARKRGLKVKNKEKILIANFPNTFLAFVPYSDVEKLAEEVENAIKQKWKEIADETKKLLKEKNIEVYEDLWNSQIKSTIEIISAWLKFFTFDKFNNVKEDLPEDLKNNQEKILQLVEKKEGTNYGYFYALTYEILSAILAQKSRFWNYWEEKPITSKKCLMCGKRNALVENNSKESYRSWDGEKWRKVDVKKEFKHLLKEGERLCAVCLTKRFYGFKDGVFKKLFGINPPKQESVVHVAAKDFIENAKNHSVLSKIIEKDIELIYEHEWGESKNKIPEEKRNVIKELEKETNKDWKKLKGDLTKVYNQFGRPNKYYAILMMDGDRIGKMLSGDNLPKFEEFLHPAFKDEIKKQEKNDKLINTKRILSPSHHIAISRAMKDFSLHKVPKIVERHNGFLVYAGGDDVLALFPADKVLDAAYEIQETFKKDFYEVGNKKVMGLGSKASMSAGIVFAHYKWPLYDVLERVRKAEKKAKGEYGRDAFCITFIKRSGEILTAGGKWNVKKYFDDILDFLSPRDEEEKKLSNRFIYDFMEVVRTFQKENGKWEEPYISMLKSDIKRLLRRRNYKSKMRERDIEGALQKIFYPLIDKYIKNEFPLENIGLLMKILYDAYKGE